MFTIAIALLIGAILFLMLTVLNAMFNCTGVAIKAAAVVAFLGLWMFLVLKVYNADMADQRLNAGLAQSLVKIDAQVFKDAEGCTLSYIRRYREFEGTVRWLDSHPAISRACGGVPSPVQQTQCSRSGKTQVCTQVTMP